MTILIVLAAAVTAAVVTLAAADRVVHARFVERALADKASAGSHGRTPLTEADLRDLPEPMARYLRFSGAVGRKRIDALRLVHSGQFKPGVNKPWMKIYGEYYITTKRPAFSWYGKIRLAPGVSIVAFDSYCNGAGRMLVKALSLFAIVDDRSGHVAQSAFGRCVAELTMAPTFFLDRQHVRCEQTGPDAVRCTVADAGFSTDADLHVNADGSLDRVVVMRYFDRGRGQASLERFTGKASRPKEFAGRMLASRFDGVWNLPEGDLHYVGFDVDSVQYE